MTTQRSLSLTLALAAALSGPAFAQASPWTPDWGATLRLQRPLGNYQSEVLDAGLGYGIGARVRFSPTERHGLTFHLDYDFFPEGGTETHGSNYILNYRIQVREQSMGLDYEWRFGAKKRAYLFGGPVYRRWKDRREYSYYQTQPGTIPASFVDSTSPSKLGYSLGWGYRATDRDTVEFRLVQSDYGTTGFKATSLQTALTIYW